jgi:hypothetical protein
MPHGENGRRHPQAALLSVRIYLSARINFSPNQHIPILLHTRIQDIFISISIHITYTRSLAMPLVVPGITTSLTGDQKTDWVDKLLGKKLTDSTNDEVVRINPTFNQWKL